MASGAGSTVLRTTDGGTNWERCYSAVAEPSRAGLRARSGLAMLGSPVRGEAPFVATGLAGSFGVVIYDAAGCQVRNLRGNGPQLVWDGRNDTGEPVQSGLYLARLGSGDSGGTVSFVLLGR